MALFSSECTDLIVAGPPPPVYMCMRGVKTKYQLASMGGYPYVLKQLCLNFVGSVKAIGSCCGNDLVNRNLPHPTPVSGVRFCSRHRIIYLSVRAAIECVQDGGVRPCNASYALAPSVLTNALCVMLT